jgi:hypothetical protein
MRKGTFELKSIIIIINKWLSMFKYLIYLVKKLYIFKVRIFKCFFIEYLKPADQNF